MRQGKEKEMSRFARLLKDTYIVFWSKSPPRA